ncbi:MAG: hypothetical protein ACRDMV_04905 [Streptosporangiales bacterium]
MTDHPLTHLASELCDIASRLENHCATTGEKAAVDLQDIRATLSEWGGFDARYGLAQNVRRLLTEWNRYHDTHSADDYAYTERALREAEDRIAKTERTADQWRIASDTHFRRTTECMKRAEVTEQERDYWQRECEAYKGILERLASEVADVVGVDVPKLGLDDFDAFAATVRGVVVGAGIDADEAVKPATETPDLADGDQVVWRGESAMVWAALYGDGEKSMIRLNKNGKHVWGRTGECRRVYDADHVPPEGVDVVRAVGREGTECLVREGSRWFWNFHYSEDPYEHTAISGYGSWRESVSGEVGPFVEHRPGDDVTGGENRG